MMGGENRGTKNGNKEGVASKEELRSVAESSEV